MNKQQFGQTEYIEPNTITITKDELNNKNVNRYEIRGGKTPPPDMIVQPFGLKEYKKQKIITKEELNNNIKKITNFEYITMPKNIFNGHYIQINMKNYELADKILKSFCIKFISKELNSQPIISEHFILEIVKNITFEVKIGGKSGNWSGKFINGINCIIDNILLPINCLEYHSVYLELKNIVSIVNLFENLELVILGEYVDLYSEINNTLQTNMIEQVICIEDKYNIVRIMCGMAGNRFGEYISLDKFNFITFEKAEYGTDLDLDLEEQMRLEKYTNELNMTILHLKKDIVKESNIFVGKPLIINEIEGFEIINFKSGYNIKYVDKALTYGYDFVCWCKCDSFENIENYYRKIIYKNKFSHNYKIKIYDNIRYDSDQFDSIDQIEIIIDNMNFDKFDEPKLFYYINDKKIDHKIKFNIFNNIIKINLDSKHLIIYNDTIYIGLEFITNSPDEPIKNKILFLTKKFIWSNKYIIKIKKHFENQLEFVPCKY
jgi:hypothetical protein